MTSHASAASTRILGICGVASACFFAAADFAGIALTPGYSAWSNAISELVERGAARKDLVDFLLLPYHGLVVPFAIGIRRAICRDGGHGTGPVLLGFAGVAGVILTLFFPCDPGCEPFVSISGTLHIFIAIPMGLSILVAIWLTAGQMRQLPRWHGLVIYSRSTAVAGALLAVATVALAETEVVGVLERVLTWCYLQWYVFVGAKIAAGHS